MSSFLMATWDGGGAVPPLLSVAEALAARGHDVRVLADPVLRPAVEASGVQHVPWSRAPHRTRQAPETDLFKDWEARTPAGAFARVRDRLMFGPAGAVAQDVLDELGRRHSDVLAFDILLAGAKVAADAAGIPAVGIHTTIDPFPMRGRPAFGPGLQPARGALGHLRDRALNAMGRRMWNLGLPALNAARAERGLPPVDDALGHLLDADRVLVLTSAAFDLPGVPRDPRVVVAGPRLDDPAWSTGSWTKPPGDGPLVLVGLSSTYQEQAPQLQRAAHALGTLPVRGLVTTGPSARLPGPAPANVTVVEAAPHSQVMREAAAVVTHGGHGTVIKALAAGVPLVVLPMGRDQPDVAARVVAAGAGVRLRPSASPARIAAAVRTVLEDPAYRAAAGRLAGAIAREVAEDRALAELEAAAARAPALSPA